MSNFNKLLLASGVAAAMSGVSMPSHAIIEGAAGEALLVPFVLYSNPTGDFSLIDLDEPSINTLITVTTPAAVGFDTIPAFFTAPNTTPTNPGPPVTTASDPDLGPQPGPNQKTDRESYYQAALHVYFFDQTSTELLNFAIPTSPDDLTIINWGHEVETRSPGLNGTKGYIVITNEKTWGWNEAARFTMFGDAFMLWPTNIGLIDTKIPVLPMSDGEDLSSTEAPSTVNNVIHNGQGSVTAASPLTSGMRTNRSNGNGLKDYTLFDLTMSNRIVPTLHVIWVDENIKQLSVGYVSNDVEQACSQTVPILNELNVYWTSIPTLWPGQKCLIDPVTRDPIIITPDNPATPGIDETVCQPGVVPNLPWVDVKTELCYPGGVFNVGLDIFNSDILYPGYLTFRINEYIDNNLGAPESAAVAFSIQMQIDVVDAARRNLINFNVLPTLLPVETALGHERGQFTDL